MPYQFTNDWFDSTTRPVWEQLFTSFQAGKVLEIGSFEGASACFLIETLGARGPVELHCIDSWEGGEEHLSTETDMAAVERRFDHNTGQAVQKAGNQVTLVKHKGRSVERMGRLLASGVRDFQFVYVDGSHQAPDVLTDAVLAFELTAPGGVIAFDDYLWKPPENVVVDSPTRRPKLAVDAFTNIFDEKIRILSLPLYQLYVQKTAP
ncbi:MAG: class I SAM-dependent methyltransferase [Alphaproteobacteria bacterium]|nr:class I SAM-dependent methyltransferase [Alphaproteobacteria bacterium]